MDTFPLDGVINLDIREDGPALVVTPQEQRIDARTSEDFLERIRSEVAKGYRTIVLDLSKVEFLDSLSCLPL